MYNCASSAYCWWEIPKSETSWPIGEMKREKRRGSKTEPRGTPKRHIDGSDEADLMRTIWHRLLRYDESHARAVPDMPKLVESLENKILWSIVSKAAFKPSETSSVGWLWSADRTGRFDQTYDWEQFLQNVIYGTQTAWHQSLEMLKHGGRNEIRIYVREFLRYCWGWKWVCDLLECKDRAKVFS